MEILLEKQLTRQQQIVSRKRTGKMYLEDIVRQVKHGNIPACFAAIQIKQLEKDFKRTLSEIEEEAKDELRGVTSYTHGDYQLKFKEGSRTIDYSGCEEVVVMEKHLKSVKEKYKAALEGVEKGNTVLLEGHSFADQNGEQLPLPTHKYNKSSIVLTKV